MSFQYDKNKSKHDSDSFWTSYSDLFLGLSTIFLLLYVVSSLRSGTSSLQVQVENQKLAMEVEQLQQQLKMYQGVKENYMNSEASKDEVREYQELMDKLTLLKEDAGEEKNRLRQLAKENEKKEDALNKYQSMVMNVINANKFAKSKIKNREEIIDEKDVEINELDTNVASLQTEVEDKKKQIEVGQNEIRAIQGRYKSQQDQLRAAYRSQKMTKAAFEQKMSNLDKIAKDKISNLEGQNKNYSAQISQAQAELQNMQGELSSTKGQLSAAQGQLGSASKKISDLGQELGAKAGEANRLKGELNQAQGELGSASRKIASLGEELGAKEGETQKLKGQMGNLQGQLAVAKAEIEARKVVANEIQKGFGRAGIKAEVDGETGDVLLDFGSAYFESDSANMKQDMKSILEKAMPVYAKSLMGNPKVANKISAVEIVGFASPTYQGRFVDPKSSNPKDKEALKYNMDLSYRRARSIFNYVIDGGGMQFEHQKELLPLMKVSGRSFLESMKVNRDVASYQEFCKVNDCKKAQRVVIKFSMDRKK